MSYAVHKAPTFAFMLVVSPNFVYLFMFLTNIFVLRKWKRGTIQVHIKYTKVLPSKATKLKTIAIEGQTEICLAFQLNSNFRTKGYAYLGRVEERRGEEEMFGIY